MSSVIGVSSVYQTAPTDKPPLKAAALASAPVPSSFLRCFPMGVSRCRALVALAIATPNSVPGEEAFKGLGGRSSTKSPLESELEVEEDGGEFDEDDEEDYGSQEAEGAGDFELAIANLGLPQQLVDSIKKRRIINHLLFPIQEAMRLRAVRRPWYLSGGVGTLIAAANAMQIFPPNALAQMCGATMKQAAFIAEGSNTTCHDFQRLVLLDLDPATAKLAISIIGPLLSAYGFLFILRIVMSWYPKVPVSKFPYVVAYAPTEPPLILTRKLIPPLGGVDVTPVVWFGLISFLNEILVGPQGLLVLLSQQV